MLNVRLSRYAKPVTAEELTAMMMAQGADLQVTWTGASDSPLSLSHSHSQMHGTQRCTAAGGRCRLCEARGRLRACSAYKSVTPVCTLGLLQPRPGEVSPTEAETSEERGPLAEVPTYTLEARAASRLQAVFDLG